MATQKQGGTKRKRRGRAGAPRAVGSPRREQQAQRRVVTDRERRAGERVLGKVGERPPSPFGGLPVSEVAIFAGAVAFIIGLVQGGANPALIVGLIVVVLGVVEVTAREHFSGFRSHTTLLAGIPAVGVGIAIIALVGSHTTRQFLLVVVVLVFAGLFYAFRRSFMAARQRRVARR